jgi:hypothetical protein
MVDRDPVIYNRAFKASKYLHHFVFVGDTILYVHEKVFCVIFKVSDDDWCDLSCGKLGRVG